MTEDDIESVARRMRDSTLPESEWTHQAHFAAALWLLREEGDAAFKNMPEYIRQYNVARGNKNTATEGYHETITLASLRAARHYLIIAAPGTPLSPILEAIIAGGLGRSGWLLDYWSKDLLFSVKARREWIEPDIKPLPFAVI